MKLTMDLECVPNLSCGLDWLEIFDEMNHGPGGIAKLATWRNVYCNFGFGPKLDWNFDEIDHGPGMSAQLVIWSKMAVNLIVGIRCSTGVKLMRKIIFVNVCGLSFTFSFFPSLGPNS